MKASRSIFPLLFAVVLVACGPLPDHSGLQGHAGSPGGPGGTGGVSSPSARPRFIVGTAVFADGRPIPSFDVSADDVGALAGKTRSLSQLQWCVAKPIEVITPENRIERWKKLWATPRLLDDAATDDAFEEFQEAFVPSHMHKQFLKFFGAPKAQFGNRFFMEDAVYQNWNTKLSQLGAGSESHVEVTVIYGSPTALEGHALRGEPRRTLRDIIVDDWQAACAIVRAGSTTVYLFVEPKMKGCMIRIIQTSP